MNSVEHFNEVRMGFWSTPTPALSPQERGATVVVFSSKLVAAISSLLDAEKNARQPSDTSALPLLGERAGVRADVVPDHRVTTERFAPLDMRGMSTEV